jgi:hypothetical protein
MRSVAITGMDPFVNATKENRTWINLKMQSVYRKYGEKKEGIQFCFTRHSPEEHSIIDNVFLHRGSECFIWSYLHNVNSEHVGMFFFERITIVRVNT